MGKFKILAIIDVVVIIALVIVMFSLKGQYNQQAQSSVKEQVGAYKEKSNAVLQEQWRSIDQYGMAWKLLFATLTGDKTEATFDATAKAVFEDKDARLKQLSYMYTAAGINADTQNLIGETAGMADKLIIKDENGVKEIACGKNCVITFTFAKGKLTNQNYNALVEYNMAENFKLEAPAAFDFEKGAN